MKALPLALLLLGLCLSGAVRAETLVSFPEDRSFLPKTWLEDPIDARIEPLAPGLRLAARGILETALSRYPTELRERFLAGVAVVGSLRFYDVAYGGTYLGNSRRIVLVYRDSFDPRGFEQRFHHEFSSILLKLNERHFDHVRWTAANAPGFAYRADGILEEPFGDRSEATRVLGEEQEKTGGSGSGLLALDPERMRSGFLTAYNQVSIEQDLNETAAHLFTNPELWRLCQEHPRIDQKIDVLIDFYRQIDPRMDRLYFRRLTEAPAPPSEP